MLEVVSVRRLRGESGQGLTEAAFILPLLTFLLLAMVSFVVVLNTKVAVTSAAREAARCYAVYQDTSRAKQVAEQNLRDAVMGYAGGCKVTIQPSGGYVTVTVTYDQPTLVPGLFRILGANTSAWGTTVRLSSAAVFRIEPR